MKPPTTSTPHQPQGRKRKEGDCAPRRGNRHSTPSLGAGGVPSTSAPLRRAGHWWAFGRRSSPPGLESGQDGVALWAVVTCDRWGSTALLEFAHLWRVGTQSGGPG